MFNLTYFIFWKLNLVIFQTYISLIFPVYAHTNMYVYAHLCDCIKLIYICIPNIKETINISIIYLFNQMYIQYIKLLNFYL